VRVSQLPPAVGPGLLLLQLLLLTLMLVRLAAVGSAYARSSRRALPGKWRLRCAGRAACKCIAVSLP
jgi:hypothetical protein